MPEAGLRERRSAPRRALPAVREAMRTEVLEGLARPQKALAPKYFYDARGSELFERITELDEYYPTRTERKLLERWIPDWIAPRPPAALVELGAGSAAKSRVILDAMRARRPGGRYVPVDVSADFLHETARALRAEYPELHVQPLVADMTGPLDLPPAPPPTWYALLGSTLGNFEADEAVVLLEGIARSMGSHDRLLLGADLRPGPRKSTERLERAYDDALGVTAAFNLNVLRVLNRELGADFDPCAFRHRAFWVEEKARIEMHLVSERRQTVAFAGGVRVGFERGESVRTEISCKYDRPSLAALLERAGLGVERWAEDTDGLFALVLARCLP